MSKVKLGQVAREHKGKASIAERGCLPIVGLEHLSSGDIDLLGFDDPGETTFTKAFDEGHVLFGRRRAYLRKASVATFRGICSGDIIVIEADEEKLSPRLLPFIIQNDRLFDYAVENSAGSLSPRVKWQRLAEYEFALPSLEDQEKLADVLWAAQETKRKYRELLTTCDDIVKSRFVEMFGDPDPKNNELPSATIEDLATDIRYGTAKKASDEGRYKYLRMNNMTDDGRLKLDDLKYITLEGPELDSCLVRKGDLLFNRTNSREKVGKTSVFDFDEPMVIAGYIVRVRLDDRVRPAYVSACLNSNYGKALLKKMAKGAVGQANISATEMSKIRIPLPSIEAQDMFLDFVSQVDKSRVALQQALDDLNAMMAAILNEELSA